MKGNLLIGQSGGPTAVINASLAGAIRAGQTSKQVDRVFGMRFGIEGYLQGLLTDVSGLSATDLDMLAATPSSALYSCRYKLQDEDLPAIKERFEKDGISLLVYIGGNDTMDTIHRIEQYCRETGYELRGVGVPKTVDNDLFATDHTPGYPSAARYVALSVQQAGRLARDMQRVDSYTIFQTVGRDAGWLAASSMLAKRAEDDPPHLIYLPERPITRERVVGDVQSTLDRIGWCSIVIGEGTTWESGEPVSSSKTSDAFANVEYGAMGGTSAAMVLHKIIADETGKRGEFQVTESLPMAAQDRVVALDQEEAEACGREAVRIADDGRSGVMVTIERNSSDPYEARLSTAPLEDVAIRAKPMPDEFTTSNGVTDDFLMYARPLVGELPEYFSFPEA